MKWWPDTCSPGDMVRVSIGSVMHYGVFISEDEIIQFGPPPVSLSSIDSESICVCSATPEEFSCGNIIEHAVLDRSEQRKRLPAAKTVELAKSRLGEKGYSLLHNNCEHFAYECVFGEKRSSQEDEARARWANRCVLDVYIAPLPEDIQITPVVCAERQEEIDSTGNPELRQARYYDWQVLMYAAGRSFNLREDELSFSKDANGRWSCDRFSFSLSHTKDAVAVAVSNGSVGVDIENINHFERRLSKKENLLTKLFSKITTPAEEENCSEDDFIRLWLKKESIFKCSGRTGARLFSPSGIDTGSHNAQVYSIASHPELMFAVCGDNMRNIRFYLYENGSAHPINSEVTVSEKQS